MQADKHVNHKKHYTTVQSSGLPFYFSTAAIFNLTTPDSTLSDPTRANNINPNPLKRQNFSLYTEKPSSSSSRRTNLIEIESIKLSFLLTYK